MIILDPFIIYLIVILTWIWFRGNYYIRNRQQFNVFREVIVHLYFIYLLGVAYMTLRPFYFIYSLAGGRPLEFDTHLFYNLLHMADGYEKFQLLYSVGNIMLFVPLGLFLPLLFKHARHFLVIVLIGLLSSLTIEFTQAIFTPTRYGTVDDLVFNTFGAVIGYLLFLIIKFASKTLMKVSKVCDW